MLDVRLLPYTICGTVLWHFFFKFQQGDRFIEENKSHVEANIKSNYLTIVSNRWLSNRIQTIANLMIFLIALFCVIQKDSLQVNLCHKLFFLQNMGRTCCVQKVFWMSETISVHNMFSAGLSLEFSCIKLVIQWTICRHIVG